MSRTSRTARKVLPSLFLALVAGLLGGCSESPSTAPSESPTPVEANRILAADGVPSFPASPSDFVTGITNPYLAFEPGKVFRYESETEDGLETIVVTVTRKTKKILGVSTTVVHDEVFLDGELTEDTFDWYAQDKDGNVWYFGENTKELEDGHVISTAGSWQAGVDGAMPGIIMLVEPEVGVKYQQEIAPGVAEDMAQIKSLSETVVVPYGTFTGCLKTAEWTPLSPGPREEKYYAPGVGLVLEVHLGSGERVELMDIE